MIILRSKLFAIDDPYTPRKNVYKRRRRYTKGETRADRNDETHPIREDKEEAERICDEIDKDPTKEKEIIDREIDKIISRSASKGKEGRADIAACVIKAIHNIKSERKSSKK